MSQGHRWHILEDFINSIQGTGSLTAATLQFIMYITAGIYSIVYGYIY